MKRIIGMFLGAAIGITLALLLTLQLWGNSFWQIAGSVFIGIVAGLFIASPKEAWHIVAGGLLSALIYASEFGFGSRWKQFQFKQLKKFIPGRLAWINTIIFILLLLPLFVPVYTNFFDLIKRINGLGDEIWIIMSAFVLIIYVLLVIMSMMPSFWKGIADNKLGVKIMAKIWKGRYEEYEKDFGLDKISPLIGELRLNFWSSLARCGACSLFSFIRIWVGILFLIYSIVTWFLTMFLGIVLAPLFIFKKIAEQNWTLLVALAITIGALTGTFLESFAWGIGSGLFSLSVLLFFKKVIPTNYLQFFFTYKNGLNGLLTGHRWA